jgi:hypothetical protein
MKSFRWTTYLGLAVWVLFPGVVWWVVCTFVPGPELPDGLQRLWTQWQRRSAVQSAVTQQRLIVNYRDPVFTYSEDGQPLRIGHVTSPSVVWAPVGTAVQVQVYDARFPWQTGRLELHRPNRNLARVAEIMMTEERLARLNIIFDTVRQQHQQELTAELGPIIREAFTELRPIIEDELRVALADHRPQFNELSDKYHAKIVNQRLVPLVKSDILPVVQKHATPVLERIGSEMWQKVSLWRFAWRYVYDGSVGPSDKLVQQEWNRFVQQHALPILQSHSQDFVDLQTVIVRELAANPRVTQAIRDSLDEVIDDAEVWSVVRSMVAQGVTNNPRVERKLREVLQSPRTQQTLARIGDRLEPYAVVIGQELFGSPQEVNQEFALVLRHMILNKDEQWLVWVPDSPDVRSTSEASTANPVTEKTAGSIPLSAATELGVPPFFVDSPTDRFEFDVPSATQVPN